MNCQGAKDAKFEETGSNLGVLGALAVQSSSFSSVPPAGNRPLQTSDFDFDLPDDLIAQCPVEPRDRSRLLVVDRRAGTFAHRVFADLSDLLAAGDVLVRNDTRVVPARLVGHRVATGGKWEGLFLRGLPGGTWEVLATT